MSSETTLLAQADAALSRAQEKISQKRLEEALADLHEASAGFESAGEVFGLVLALKISSEVNRDLGRLDGALTQVKEAHTLLAEKKPDAEQLPDFATETGSIYAELGQLEKAKQWYTQGLRGYKSHGNVQGQAHNYLALAGLARYGSRESQAQELLETAYGLYRQAGMPQQMVQVRSAMAQGLLATGEQEQALNYLTEALDLAREHNDLAGLGETHQLLALVIAQQGNSERAEEHLRAAAEHYRAAGDLEAAGFVQDLLQQLPPSS